MTPRSVSLTGCRTKPEALARIRALVEETQADALRKLESDLLTLDPSACVVDIDGIDGLLEEQRALMGRQLEAALGNASDILDELGVSPAGG